MFRSKNFYRLGKKSFTITSGEVQKHAGMQKTDSQILCRKIRGWQQLCTEFNSNSTYMKRDVKQLQGAWKNFKARAKADAAYVRRERIKTGRGSPTKLKTETEIVQSKLICNVCFNNCIC